MSATRSPFRDPFANAPAPRRTSEPSIEEREETEETHTLRSTSLAMEEPLLEWLRVQAAGERNVTQRGIINELVRRLKAAPAAERRSVFDAVVAWELEQRR